MSWRIWLIQHSASEAEEKREKRIKYQENESPRKSSEIPNCDLH